MIQSFFFVVHILLLAFQITNAGIVSANSPFALPLQKYFKEPFISDHFNEMNPVRVGKYYKMLGLVDQLFTEHDIQYFVIFGTLLGGIRHGGLIPWDDDTDIGAFAGDAQKIWQLQETFKSYGYRLAEWVHGIVIFSNDEDEVQLDIFFMEEKQGKDKGKIHLSAWSAGIFSKAYFLKKELNPLIRIKYGPIELYAPNASIRYLQTYYGKDVMTHARVRPTNARYTIKDFSPAEYVW